MQYSVRNRRRLRSTGDQAVPRTRTASGLGVAPPRTTTALGTGVSAIPEPVLAQGSGVLTPPTTTTTEEAPMPRAARNIIEIVAASALRGNTKR